MQACPTRDNCHQRFFFPKDPLPLPFFTAVFFCCAAAFLFFAKAAALGAAFTLKKLSIRSCGFAVAFIALVNFSILDFTLSGLKPISSTRNFVSSSALQLSHLRVISVLTSCSLKSFRASTYTGVATSSSSSSSFFVSSSFFCFSSSVSYSSSSFAFFCFSLISFGIQLSGTPYLSRFTCFKISSIHLCSRISFNAVFGPMPRIESQ
mmetsp:Transcript_20667/g.30408  ORF Transcript_20667/g.30408 Transcript_20667/m.30408 type:complete len:207 (+) Transcript_20667:84-704(+)